MPVAGTSFSHSPVPMPSTTRPGTSRRACRTPAPRSTGDSGTSASARWCRCTSFVVRAPSAPSQTIENGAWPSVCFHGWKWSLTNAESKPTCSAMTAKSSSFEGANCSADALYPSLSTGCSLCFGKNPSTESPRIANDDAGAAHAAQLRTQRVRLCPALSDPHDEGRARPRRPYRTSGSPSPRTAAYLRRTRS